MLLATMPGMMQKGVSVLQQRLLLAALRAQSCPEPWYPLLFMGHREADEVKICPLYQRAIGSLEHVDWLCRAVPDAHA